MNLICKRFHNISNPYFSFLSHSLFSTFNPNDKLQIMQLTNDFIEDFATAAIHNSKDEGSLHAHTIPIYATSTFVFDSAEQGMNRFAGNEPGYIYSRFANPTTAAAEKLIASLEAFGLKDSNGNTLELSALLHASGQGALSSLCFSVLKTGDKVLTNTSIYGGTQEFFSLILSKMGIETIFTDLTDVQNVANILSVEKNIQLIHIETPANPTMACTDIASICTLAQSYHIKVSVDNTFATPYLQQPFALGADFVYHSTTKFLNGHGTAIGGVLLGKDIVFMKSANKISKLLGANSNPFDAFLLINGIKTLAIRMQAHCKNAEQVALFLNNHKAISKVYYNGLVDHPHYQLSAQQMRHAGALISFDLKNGLAAGIQFINKLKICTRAVSLGTTDTLISHPASMSHSDVPKEKRLAAGISDGLIRMSVGTEGIHDILKDLEQALEEL